MSSFLKALRPIACVLSLSLAAGCGDACLNLANQICSCQPDDTSRANCQQRARDQGGIFSVEPQNEEFCQGKLDSEACECQSLITPEGRMACGLSFPLADGGP